MDGPAPTCPQEPLSVRCHRRAPTATRLLPRGGFIALAPPAGRRCPPPLLSVPSRRPHGAGHHPFRGSACPSQRPSASPPPVDVNTPAARSVPGSYISSGTTGNPGPLSSTGSCSPARRRFGCSEWLRPALLHEVFTVPGKSFTQFSERRVSTRGFPEYPKSSIPGKG